MPRSVEAVAFSTGWYGYGSFDGVHLIEHEGRVFIWGDAFWWDGLPPDYYGVDNNPTTIIDVGGIPEGLRPSDVVSIPLYIYAGGSDPIWFGLTWETEIRPDGSWVIFDRLTRPFRISPRGTPSFYPAQATYNLDGSPDMPTVWESLAAYTGTDTGGSGGTWSTSDGEIGIHDGIAHVRGSIVLDAAGGGTPDVPLEFGPTEWSPLHPVTGASYYLGHVVPRSVGDLMQTLYVQYSGGGTAWVLIREYNYTGHFIADDPALAIYKGADMAGSASLEGPAVDFIAGGEDIASDQVLIDLEWSHAGLTFPLPLVVGRYFGVAFNIQPDGDHYRAYTEIWDNGGTPTMRFRWSKVVGGAETILGSYFGLEPNQRIFRHLGATAEFIAEATTWTDVAPLPSGGEWGYFVSADVTINEMEVLTGDGTLYLGDGPLDYPAATDSITVDGLWWPTAWSPAPIDLEPSAGDTEVTFDASPSTGIDLTYEWDFDGESGTGLTPTHVFAPGTHPVVLTVTDGVDRTDSVSHDVEITSGSQTYVLSEPVTLDDADDFDAVFLMDVPAFGTNIFRTGVLKIYAPYTDINTLRIDLFEPSEEHVRMFDGDATGADLGASAEEPLILNGTNENGVWDYVGGEGGTWLIWWGDDFSGFPGLPLEGQWKIVISGGSGETGSVEFMEFTFYDSSD